MDVKVTTSDINNKVESFAEIAWERFSKNYSAMSGAIVLGAFILMGIFADLIMPFDPKAAVGTPFMKPGPIHWMGTDNLARDTLSRFLVGLRVSLMVGFGAATLSNVIGVIIGSIAGYLGGWVDALLMRIADIFLTIPMLVLGIVIAAFLGGSVLNILLIIAFLSWPRSARIVRSEFLTLREREFVHAARAVGESDLWIVFREILPNALPPVLVNWSLEVGSDIITEAGLSFLGMGDPEMGSWGMMLQDAQRFLRTAWWMSVFPGLGIALASLSANLIGEGLSDALNPKLEER
ncbi:MAG: ABC transporter permease [Anaerolineales bacterium]